MKVKTLLRTPARPLEAPALAVLCRLKMGLARAAMPIRRGTRCAESSRRNQRRREGKPAARSARRLNRSTQRHRPACQRAIGRPTSGLNRAPRNHVRTRSRVPDSPERTAIDYPSTILMSPNVVVVGRNGMHGPRGASCAGTRTHAFRVRTGREGRHRFAGARLFRGIEPGPQPGAGYDPLT